MAKTRSVKTLPFALAHYTTLTGLVGIVESGTIWASNVSFLNDHRELLHGLEASLAAIEILSAKSGSASWAAALKHAEQALREGKIPETYAACFCENPDLLSQWRGYGGSSQGIAVSFKRSSLVKLLAKQGASLHSVVYCDLTTRKKMREALESELSELDELEAILGTSPKEARNEDAYRAVCKLLPQFKHNGFRDERELRFVVQAAKTSNLLFRANGNVVVPYIALGPGSGTKLPITRVTVGPGKNQELTARSLSLFLSDKGYTDVEIISSRVPFRT